ncbi:Amino acid permease [Microbotryomycetes sp. JL201]|nr:Amino acid permease [Microbotryomycetes sp. JL201]
MEKDYKAGSDKTSADDVYVSTERAPELYDPSKESIFTRLGVNAESFKRAPGATGGLVVHGESVEVDPLKGGANPMLQQKMKPRHLQMIAVGGSIGTGLFIGSGQALRNGGPAGILIAWSLIGVMLINVTQALGEMCIMFPVSGGFYTLAVRFLDPGFGCALGWNYFLQWAAVLPLEISAAGITVRYWTNEVPVAAWVTIFWLAIIAVNVFGTLGYAEEEFWSSCLKLLVVVMFIFIGIIINCGGGPSDGEYTTYLGGEYWRNPGAFSNGFKGLCAVFVTAAFSFAGTELVGLAATETPNPRKTMPGAVKGTFWRITLIYVSSLLIIGLNIPWNDERLLNGSGAGTSPFVIMVDRAGIPGLNHLINATICVSVLSIGLSCVYAGSRVLTALAETGFAPKCFTYVDKSGRPLWSVLVLLAFGPIAYVDVAPSARGQVFDWLLALSGLSTLFTWGAICLCHIRFRMAWKYNGHSVEELPFRAMGGVYGSWFGVGLICLVLIAQFYIAVWPLGDQPTGTAAAESFFKVFLAVPVIIAVWIISFIWKRTLPVKISEIDIDTGRKSFLTVEEMRAYRAERALAPWYIKVYRALFSN